MSLDALILADYDVDSVSASSSMRLMVDGQPATIQVVKNCIAHNGRIVPPVFGQGHLSWSSAYKLNGLSLLSDLQRHGYQAALVNSFLLERPRFEKLLSQKPKAIVISTTFIVNKTGLNTFVTEVRKLAPDIPIIVGGPFVFQSYCIFKRRQEPEFSLPQIQKDFLFWGENEPDADLLVTALPGRQALRDALECIKAKRPLVNIPDTAWRNSKNDYQFGSKRQVSEHHNQDRIDWASLPDEVFASQVVPLQASSGCPFRCAFCNFVKDHQKAYAKSAEQIVDEMAAVAARGAKYIWFVDDIFRLGKGDLTATSEAIISAGLDLRWMTFIRADTVKDIDFELLKKAGCHELQFGLESADPRVLKAMNKKADPELYRQTIKKVLASGINVSAYFLFGHPGETQESMDRTIAFMQEIEFPDLPGNLSWSIYPFLLVPLSPIYEARQRQTYGLQGYMNEWQHKTMDFESAMQGIRRAVMALDHSAPIYRNDNLQMLDELDVDQRKSFFRRRLRLAKQVNTEGLDSGTICGMFSDILPKP